MRSMTDVCVYYSVKSTAGSPRQVFSFKGGVNLAQF